MMCGVDKIDIIMTNARDWNESHRVKKTENKAYGMGRKRRMIDDNEIGCTYLWKILWVVIQHDNGYVEVIF